MLTGFCKFGDRCWKKHPKAGPATTSAKIAEPVTRKFQGWMQAQEQMKNPRPNEASPPLTLSSTMGTLNTSKQTDQHLQNTSLFLDRLLNSMDHTLELFQTAVKVTGLPIRELLPVLHAKALSEVRGGKKFVRLALHLREQSTRPLTACSTTRSSPPSYVRLSWARAGCKTRACHK